MAKVEVLRALDVGGIVAETDPKLSSNFVLTNHLSDLTQDRHDIVRGAKGSGKSAILKLLKENQRNFPTLSNVILVPANDVTTNALFQDAFNFVLAQGRTLDKISDNELVDAWKIYFLNVIIRGVPPKLSAHPRAPHLAEIIKKYALKSREPGFFQMLKFSLLRILNPTAISGSFTTPYVSGTGTATFGDSTTEMKGKVEPIPIGEAYAALDSVLYDSNQRIWVTLDRLDEAFPGQPEIETRALRSLLYAFKDLSLMRNIKLKIAIRDDIYLRITRGSGFAALTHVEARVSTPIQWKDERKLLALLMNRILSNPPVAAHIGINLTTEMAHEDRLAAFYKIFPEKVNNSDNQRRTWDWIRSRAQDGNHLITPRDILALVTNARAAQLEIWDHEPEDEHPTQLFSPAALKIALAQLSETKVQTVLFAEYPHLQEPINKLRGGKAEHNVDSLASQFGDKSEDIRQQLVAIGFLEVIHSSKSFKVPFLYRDGLGIKQGKAFDENRGDPREEEEN